MRAPPRSSAWSSPPGWGSSKPIIKLRCALRVEKVAGPLFRGGIRPDCAQFPHLRAKKCFLQRTRCRRKRILISFALAGANSARLFDSLSAPPEPGGALFLKKATGYAGEYGYCVYCFHISRLQQRRIAHPGAEGGYAPRLIPFPSAGYCLCGNRLWKQYQTYIGDPNKGRRKFGL